MDMLGKRLKDINVMLDTDEKQVNKSEIPIRKKIRRTND